MDNYRLLGLDIPSDETQATRFMQGLDHARYSSLQTYLINELNNSRDIYLGSAISKAKRWLIPSSRGPQDVAQHAAFGLLKKPGEKEKPKGKDSKKSSPKAMDEKHDKITRCKYCDKPGHNILVCFKLIADQAAAKSDGPSNKKKTATLSALASDPYEEETGFSSFITLSGTPTTTSTLSGIPTITPTLSGILTVTHSVFYGGGANALSDTDVILDTGANCGVVHSIHILQNVKFCPPVTFDGLAGTLTTSRKGSLGGICDAYFHPRAVANILSLSAANHEDILSATTTKTIVFICSTEQRHTHLTEEETGYTHATSLIKQPSSAQWQKTNRTTANGRSNKPVQHGIYSAD